MGDRTAPGPPPWGRVCAGHLAFYRGEHAHGQKNTNDFPGGSHPREYFILPNVQVISAGFRRIPGRPGGGPKFKNRRQGNWTETLRLGRRAARWDGRKIPWERFLRLLERARLLSRFPEKVAKNTPFPTYNGTLTCRDAASRSSSTASPIYEGCARMNPLGPRTGRGRKRERRVPRCPRPGAASRGPKNSIWHRSMAVRGPPWRYFGALGSPGFSTF